MTSVQTEIVARRAIKATQGTMIESWLIGSMVPPIVAGGTKLGAGSIVKFTQAPKSPVRLCGPAVWPGTVRVKGPPVPVEYTGVPLHPNPE